MTCQSCGVARYPLVLIAEGGDAWCMTCYSAVVRYYGTADVLLNRGGDVR